MDAFSVPSGQESNDAIACVATMATVECADELALFLSSLRIFHPELPVVLGCSSSLLEAVEGWGRDPHGVTPLRRRMTELIGSRAAPQEKHRLHVVPCLDAYGAGINRKSMESAPGVWYPTRHADFMMEKAHLVDHALHLGFPNAAFLDCDITLLAPLPTVPSDCCVGLSPHDIDPSLERLFGKYNGGFVFVRDPAVTFLWRTFTRSSRYYDQASLEDVASHLRGTNVGGGGVGGVYEFPPQVNYGFWRMFEAPRQGGSAETSVLAEVGRFSAGAGIHYRGQPLQSVHTHFSMNTDSRTTPLFNRLIKRWLRASTWEPHRALMKLL